MSSCTIYRNNATSWLCQNGICRKSLPISNIINLNFSRNLIEIQENVYYKNKNANIKADKIEINFKSKKLKISMDKQDDKVEISGKY